MFDNLLKVNVNAGTLLGFNDFKHIYNMSSCAWSIILIEICGTESTKPFLDHALVYSNIRMIPYTYFLHFSTISTIYRCVNQYKRYTQQRNIMKVQILSLMDVQLHSSANCCSKYIIFKLYHKYINIDACVNVKENMMIYTYLLQKDDLLYLCGIHVYYN